jgi:hypothetical protein
MDVPVDDDEIVGLAGVLEAARLALRAVCLDVVGGGALTLERSPRVSSGRPSSP